MLNESQLARTRGDGEICTKELPHSLAAFSSRNPAGEEGLLSPVHQSSRSRQRRFTMTPSRTATRQGQGSSIASARREPAALRNRNVGLRKRPPGVAPGTTRSEEPRSCLRAPGKLRWLPARAGRRGQAARSQQAEPNLNKMEPPFSFNMEVRPSETTSSSMQCSCSARRALQKLTPGLQVSVG